MARNTGRGRSGRSTVTERQRSVALLLVVVVAGFGALFFPSGPAVAAECRLADWKRSWKQCAEQLPPPSDACLDPPVPSAPDSGLAGWFASRTEASNRPHNPGVYIDYGYAGYEFHTYGLRCGAAGADPGIATEHMVANWELKLASGIVGAANAIREKAWDPGSLWQWADRLLERATRTIYAEVFTGFGAVTLTVVGIYLIWRSRQADMSDSLTTAGWAVLVMLVVTAVAVYPVWSANLADGVMTRSLDVVHDAVGPRTEKLPPQRCDDDCADPRPPAERASEIVTDSVLYRSWLRGMVGSETSKVARKYGAALYDAQAFSWAELERIESAPADERQEVRDAIIRGKQDRFKRVAEQIRIEDPEAYEHLQGKRGGDRIAAGFIALLSAVFFGLFDIIASILVLLAFMIFRWAVIAAPLLGTFALLRPASSGLKRLGNAVVVSIFNIMIFGAGAAIYLLAVDIITSTSGLAGWLQLVLIGLCGLAGWILLRPYQRLTQLNGSSGGDGTTLRDRLMARTRPDPEESAAERSPGTTAGYRVRPETRAETPILVPAGTAASGGPWAAPREPIRGSSAEPASGTAARPDGGSRSAGPAELVPRPGHAHVDARQHAASTSTTTPDIYVPDSRRAGQGHPAGADVVDDGPPPDGPDAARPLFIPEEWRETNLDHR